MGPAPAACTTAPSRSGRRSLCIRRARGAWALSPPAPPWAAGPGRGAIRFLWGGSGSPPARGGPRSMHWMDVYSRCERSPAGPTRRSCPKSSPKAYEETSGGGGGGGGALTGPSRAEDLDLKYLKSESLIIGY